MANEFEKTDYKDTTHIDEKDDIDESDIPPRIAKIVKWIREKVYGESVREAIARGIEHSGAIAQNALVIADEVKDDQNNLNERVNDQLTAGTIKDEEIDFRHSDMLQKTFGTMRKRGDFFDNELKSRSYNILWFGADNSGENDNLSIFREAISKIPEGSSLFFPTGRYKLSNNLIVDKKIKLSGVKPVYSNKTLINGSILDGGGIYFVDGASGAEVDSMGIINKTHTNGIDVRGLLNGIRINNCVTIAQSHGYLIESYLGLVNNTSVTNCESYDSLHGFISKATQTNFTNCIATNHQYWAFGIISDNITGADNRGEAIDNKVDNCRAVNSGVGFSQYKRDYFGDGSKISCYGNQFTENTATNCNASLNIGDVLGDTGGGKYKSYPVDSTIISGFVEESPKGDSRINQSNNLILTNLHLCRKLDLKRSYNNTGLNITAISGAKAGEYNDVQILASNASPSVKFGDTFRTNNTENVVITNLEDGIDGKEYEIVLWDRNTSISASDSIFLLNGDLNGYGNSIRFKCQSGKFFELSRTSAITSNIQINYNQASSMDIGWYTFIDVVGKGNLTNKISILNPKNHNTIITIFIRSIDGVFTFGGFDPAQFIFPKDIPNSIEFGNGLMTQWAFLPAVNKYVLITERMSNFV